MAPKVDARIVIATTITIISIIQVTQRFFKKNTYIIVLGTIIRHVKIIGI